MKKPKLTLVPSIKELESYEIVTVYLMDEGVFTFGLNEWDMYEGKEWIQFRRKDKSKEGMECFAVNGITHISFVSKGGQSVECRPTLKPVG